MKLIFFFDYLPLSFLLQRWKNYTNLKQERKMPTCILETEDKRRQIKRRIRKNEKSRRHKLTRQRKTIVVVREDDAKATK